MNSVKILIACGGSGGHIFPGIALAEALMGLDKNCEVSIVTSDRYIDTQIFKEEEFPYSVLPYNPLPDNLNPLKIFRFLLNLIKAIFKSLNILKMYRPNCVVGLGGYVSGPLVFAAWLMRKRVVIHEQNIVPSLTNRLSAIFADEICVTFDLTKNYFKKKFLVKTGNPIRLHFLKQNSNSSHKSLGLDRDRFTILIMGGSQGSTFLNNSMKIAISRMDDGQRMKLQIIHITGRKDESAVKQDYENIGVKARVYPFLDKMGHAYNVADLIVSRAGATALSEITVFGKPSILIPYSKSRVHQKENAEFFSSRGASLCIEEKDLAPGYLKNTILDLIKDSNRLNQMANQAKILSAPDAAYKLAKETLDLVNVIH